MLQIANNTVVSLRYIMKNAQSEILENTMESAPVKYVHGMGVILPQLEASLAGLSAGDAKEIAFTESQSGQTFHFNVVIDEVRRATEEEIQSRKPMKDEDCGPDCSCHQ